MIPDDDTPIGEGRKWLIATAETDAAADCPLCGKRAQLYHRRLYGDPVRGMIAAYRRQADAGGDGREWFHWARVVGSYGGDGAKLEHWGLLERASRARDPKEPGVGYWRLTDLGVLFVRNGVRLPKCARVVGIHNRFVRWCTDPHPGDTAIRDALGVGYDYDEMMGR